MRGRWAGSALGVVSVAIPAMGDVVTLNFWDASLNYGVFADGGSLPSPVQGPETMAIGSSSLVWERTDGVAHARATADYRLDLETSPSGLGFSLDLDTSAFAQVGVQPEYPGARGLAESWFDYALFDFTLSQEAWLSVTGVALGQYGPGVHLLDAGDYLLEMRGPAGRSWVDVGPSGVASSDNVFAASFQISTVPGPQAIVVLLGLAFGRGRRGRG